MSAKIIHERRHHTAKKVGNAVSGAVSYGSTVAQFATKTSNVTTVTALAAGTAVGATGIGFLVGGALLTTGFAVQAGRSAYKTNKHINNLKQIQKDIGKYACNSRHGHDHNTVVHTILPYIIEKKRAKLHRKAFVAGTIGVGSSLETARAITKKAFKYFNGSLGRNREYYATVLARHFKNCRCGCADAIVGELYSGEEMNLMLDKNFSEKAVVELLMDKMKSV